MILLFPLPGFAAKLTQGIQVERMKTVRCYSTLHFESLIKLIQTDARVQSVTESTSVYQKLPVKVLCSISILNAAMNVIRMVKLFGWETKMNVRIAGKRNTEIEWIRKQQVLNLISHNLK